MTEKQQKLLDLIKQLAIPILEEDAVKRVEGLTEEELDYLIASYQTVVNHETRLEDNVRKNQPEEYAAIKDKYYTTIEKIENDDNEKLDRILETTGNELEKLDLKTKIKLREILHQQQIDYHKLDDEHKLIYSKLTSAVLLNKRWKK